MENNEANRLKLAEAIWETLSLNALREQFILQNLERYKTDPHAFEDDCQLMELNNDGGE